MIKDELIERVMLEHWDMAACQCWFCREGRAMGLRPRSYAGPRRVVGKQLTDDQFADCRGGVVTTEPTAEPWGIIVTPTLHLSTWRNGKPGPRCRNEAVVRIADGIRVLWAKGERTRPMFGPAGDRPVCLRCIADARREAARLTDGVAVAERWNEAR